MGKPVRTEFVTHAQYAKIQNELARSLGNSEQRVIEACEAVGIEPPDMFTDVKLVVVED